MKIAKIAKDTNPDAKIKYVLNDESGVGHGTIEIETDEMIVYNIREFIGAIQFAKNFEIYPTNSGNIRIGIMFHNMTDDITPEK